jgi:phage tail sheath gpL-like
MSVLTEISITSTGPVLADLTVNLIQPTFKPYAEVNQLIDYLAKIASGSELASIDVRCDHGDGVRASGTITFTGVGSANDTILINGVTFTAKASGATGNEWNVGASATLSAAALKAAINASATALVSGHVTADNAAGVLTISSKFYDVSGNAVTIAEGVDSGNVMAVSGARLTGGVAPTANAYAFGV